MTARDGSIVEGLPAAVSSTKAQRILRRIERGVTNRLPLPAAGRFSPGPRQSMLVSYPRSGSTWLRFMLAALVVDQEASEPQLRYEVTARAVPSVHTATVRWLLRHQDRPVVHSHLPYSASYGRIVYLVRNPLDVAASRFRMARSRGNFASATGEREFVNEFLTYESAKRRHDRMSGAWSEHVGSWVGARAGDSRALFVRYEDLRAQPHDVLAQIARHLGLDASAAAIRRSVSLTSLDQMREIEKSSFPKDLTGSRGEIVFVRPASGADEHATLSDHSAEQIARACGDLMARFSYQDRSDNS
ncbi:MAG: sulfotransferase domain-containing protein [Actinomycetota bacterium]